MRGILFFLILLLLGWYVGSTYWYVCEIKGHCTEKVAAVDSNKKVTSKTDNQANKATAQTKENTAALNSNNKKTSTGTTTPASNKEVESNKPNPVPLTVSGLNSARSSNNILFTEKGFEAEYPTDINNFSNQIKNYLNRNPQKSIELTGFYRNTDPRPATLPDLGYARAEEVKKKLVASGIRANQIVTSSKMTSSFKNYKDKITGAVTFKIGNLAPEKPKETVNEEVAKTVSKEQITKIEKSVTAKSRNVYFKTGSSQIIETDELKSYFKELKTYLAYYPSKKIRVTGHTDNTGGPIKNRELGKQRAELIKNYLAKAGIKSSQIVVDSKGQNSPIADNATAEGRQKNRRVEININ